MRCDRLFLFIFYFVFSSDGLYFFFFIQLAYPSMENHMEYQSMVSGDIQLAFIQDRLSERIPELAGNN
jgi:hypothetical protein